MPHYQTSGYVVKQHILALCQYQKQILLLKRFPSSCQSMKSFWRTSQTSSNSYFLTEVQSVCTILEYTEGFDISIQFPRPEAFESSECQKCKFSDLENLTICMHLSFIKKDGEWLWPTLSENQGSVEGQNVWTVDKHHVLGNSESWTPLLTSIGVYILARSTRDSCSCDGTGCSRFRM